MRVNPMKKLTALAIKTAMGHPGIYQDGDGLFLKVDKGVGLIGFYARNATASGRTSASVRRSSAG